MFEVKKANRAELDAILETGEAPQQRNRYPFAKMEVGDYLDVPDHLYWALQGACRSFGRTHGKKFSMRKQTDGTVRCYRVE